MSITSSTIGKRTFKVILLGDSSTGKTCLIERFVNNRFQDKDNPTIGIDFLGKNVTHHSTTCRLQLWDTAGQERYRSLIPSYLKDAVCAIFVFDAARPQTLEDLQMWIDLFKDNRGERTVMAVCVNKCDLSKQYDQKNLTNLIQKNKMKCYETSALTGNGVQSMFFSLIDDIVVMQQSKRKKLVEDEDYINPPLTEDHLKSQKMTTRANQSQNEVDREKNMKLKKQEGGWKKYCCSG